MRRPIGFWVKNDLDPTFDFHGIMHHATNCRVSHSVLFNESDGVLGLGVNGGIQSQLSSNSSIEVLGVLPPLFPEFLGDRSFQHTHNVRFSYVGGAMARGIASANLVASLAECGMLGFFGSAGLPLERLQNEINTIQNRLSPQQLPWGMNLIHTPNEPELESSIVELYLKNNVRKVEAAAFMALSKALVHYAFSGLTVDNQGNTVRKNHVFAKISRPEVAIHFLTPVPEKILDELLKEGKLTPYEVQLGKNMCIAEDITVESDSGGHTDGRPLGPLFSEILQLRNRLSEQYNYAVWPRVGAAGGLGTPSAIASAFALGAAYVCVGSVHQSCVESGVSKDAKKMLSLAGLADVALTASADMFEQGVKVQVLKRGTIMPQRGNYLFSLYNTYKSIEELPAKDVLKLEKEIFRAPLSEIWADTEAFFKKVEPSQVDRAYSDAHHKMALVFRWYIGKSSQWPILEVKDRQLDYQIWCGPAMGAFNQWVKGTYLESVENRNIQQVALNLMEGAAVITKVNQLRSYGVSVGEEAMLYIPRVISLN